VGPCAQDWRGRARGHPNACGREGRRDVFASPPLDLEQQIKSQPGGRPTFALRHRPRQDPCIAGLGLDATPPPHRDASAGVHDARVFRSPPLFVVTPPTGLHAPKLVRSLIQRTNLSAYYMQLKKRSDNRLTSLLVNTQTTSTHSSYLREINGGPLSPSRRDSKGVCTVRFQQSSRSLSVSTLISSLMCLALIAIHSRSDFCGLCFGPCVSHCYFPPAHLNPTLRLTTTAPPPLHFNHFTPSIPHFFHHQIFPLVIEIPD